ncbi:MAG: preprotein translocase subunit YajC [Defluviitaleaceae bacterium]|nr:preprotein translocase subunit YajC [Defluviitaleaceae bacterium]
MTDALMSIFNRVMFLAVDLSIPGGVTPAAPLPGGEVLNGATGGGGMGWGMMILLYGGIFALMYFIFFRPQRKREKKMREMQSAITTGDNIVTSGGFFGKVADIGEDCFIVEFGMNRGVKIPVVKSHVVGIAEPKTTPMPKEPTATD